jgi:hypothetical protein
MYLRTKGKPKKTPLVLCKEAVKWYGKHLLNDKLYHNIEIHLKFENNLLKENYLGYCDWNDSPYRAKEYTIAIDSNLGKRNTLMVLAHEMVHVKQYATGEMRDYLKVNRVKWMGSIINDGEMNYWDQPWEIEAYGREKGLYYRFIDSKRKK